MKHAIEKAENGAGRASRRVDRDHRACVTGACWVRNSPSGFRCNAFSEQGLLCSGTNLLRGHRSSPAQLNTPSRPLQTPFWTMTRHFRRIDDP
jgi:hypothetical protein